MRAHRALGAVVAATAAATLLSGCVPAPDEAARQTGLLARRLIAPLGMLRLQLNPNPNGAVRVWQLRHQAPHSQELAIGSKSARLGGFEFVSAIVAHATSGENVGVGVSDDRRGTHPQHA